MRERLVLPLLLLAYFACYVPYIVLGRAVGIAYGAVPAFPIYALACAACVIAGLLLSGKWRSVSLKDPRVWWAAVGSIVIMTSSSLIYMWPKGAIVQPQQLMKVGSLMVAGCLDGRRIKPAPILLCLAAVVLGALGKSGETLLLPFCLGLGYVLGYLVKLAAIGPRKGSVGFLESEFAATALLLPPIAVVWALVTPAPVAAWLDWRPWVVGVLSTGTGVLGTAVLLLQKPHSVCASVSRAVSLLAGLAAALWLGQTVSIGEQIGVLLLAAVLVAGL